MQLTWKTLTGFAYKVDLQIILRSGAYDHSKLKQIARNVYERYVKSPDFDQILQSYLNVCWTIDGIKSSTLGVEGPIIRSNGLMMAVAAHIAQDNYNESARAKVLELQKETKKGEGVATWFFAKLSTLENFMNYAQQADWLAASLQVQSWAAGPLKNMIESGAADAGRMATDIVRELTVLRKYGVKSSFFQDGMLHEPDQAWVFMDHHEIRNTTPEWIELMPKLNFAVVSLSDKSSLTKIGTETGVIKVGKSLLSGAHLLHQGNGFAALNSDGEFDASIGFGMMPVRQFFERRNNLALYEYLRFANAIRLYDLVVPITTVNKMPAPPIERGMFDRLKNVLTKKHLLNPDLILPRLRTLENVNVLLHDLEIEIEKAEKSTAERASRELSRHAVVYHVRRLPKNKKATPEARERAKEYGIILAANETFVKSHERGIGEKDSRPHRAKISI